MDNVDELGAAENNEDATTLENLKNNAGEIMSNLRDTIWASNKEKILLTGISDRFKNYLQKIMPAYPNSRVEIFERIENNIAFPPVHALNIFRILQEALTNALKHSGATFIQISFISEPDLKIFIADNGKGINIYDTATNGNGISNMKSRAKESGYKLSINKKETGGSEVVIST
jgi:signal transduction histidine kinase